MDVALNKNYNIIDILIESANPKYKGSIIETKFELIINAIESRILTRGAHKRVTSSCKFWQLKLNILSLLDDSRYFNSDIYNYLVDDSILPLPLPENVSYKCNNISEIYLNTVILKNTNFYKVIYNNNPISDALLQIDNIDELPLTDIEYRYGDCQVFSLCIYPELQQNGTICHFFTLITKDNRYYINSSYGSDYVCIPQYTTEINIDEFNQFCLAVSNISDETNKIIFIDFFNKFFLKGGFQKRLISSDPDDWTSEERKQMSEYLPIEAGKSAEINFYFNPVFNYKFNIALIKNYKSELLKYITGMFRKTETIGRSTRKYHHYLRLNSSKTEGRKTKHIKKNKRKNKKYKKTKKRINKRLTN